MEIQRSQWLQKHLVLLMLDRLHQHLMIRDERSSEHLIDYICADSLFAWFVLFFMAQTNGLSSWTQNIDRNVHVEYSDIYK